ncbi:MAG: hypothetical protein QM564_07920 [Bergeyella sp.]
MYHNHTAQTRLVITGIPHQKEAVRLLLHTLQFSGKKIDFITSFGNNAENNDFILFEAETSQLLEYQPNLVLITGIVDVELYQKFLETVVSGGIVIYKGDDIPLAQLVENSENYFRKIPFSNPETEVSGGTLYLRTDMGEIPLQTSVAENIAYVDGVKHLAQQLGIMEEEFYESLMDFKF